MSENWQIALSTMCAGIGVAAFGGLLRWMFVVARSLGSIDTTLKQVPQLSKTVGHHTTKLAEVDQRLDHHHKRLIRIEGEDSCGA